MAADRDAHEPLALQHREGDDCGVAAALEEDDPFLRPEPAVVGVRDGEERRLRGLVVAAVGVLAVRPGEARVACQDKSVWVVAREFAPGDDPRRQPAEPRAGVMADEGLPAELLPPR